MSTIQNAAFYLVRAAEMQDATEEAARIHHRAAYGRRPCSERRANTLWNIYWTCKAAFETAVEDVRGDGALLMLGQPAAVAQATVLWDAERKATSARYAAAAATANAQ